VGSHLLSALEGEEGNRSLPEGYLVSQHSKLGKKELRTPMLGDLEQVFLASPAELGSHSSSFT